MAELFTIPSELIQDVYQCMDQGFFEDYSEAEGKLGFVTHNSRAFLRWDLFNRNISLRIPSTKRICKFPKRGTWELNLLFELEQKIVISFMSQQRYSQILKARHTKWPQYLQALLMLNVELHAPIKQTRMYDEDEPNTLYCMQILDNLCSGIDNKNNQSSWRHILVVFDAKYGRIASLVAYLLDRDMDIVEQQDWLNVVKPIISNTIDTVEPDVLSIPKTILKPKALKRIQHERLVSLRIEKGHIISDEQQ